MSTQSENRERRDQTLEALRESRMISTLRFPDPQRLPQVAESLVEAGVRFLEVAVQTPMSATIIADMSRRYQGRAFVGATGVTGMSEAETMLDAGAAFLSTPIVAPMVVARCRGAGALSIIGAFTPTEAFQSWAAQADFVSIFPAGGLGPGYLSVLRVAVPRIQIIPSGGVTLQTLPAFLRAGAAAVSVGSKLIDREALIGENYSRLTDHARRFVEAAQSPVPSRSSGIMESTTDGMMPPEDTSLGRMGH
ncbi:MAG: bifunctional 4-hydroxy-2-oxoglutarate aldolase/2-dehydro-3-deoxy-phosphogluconate aldolase [Planctomycetota bacterium]